jgi:hypothetical protein
MLSGLDLLSAVFLKVSDIKILIIKSNHMLIFSRPSSLQITCYNGTVPTNVAFYTLNTLFANHMRMTSRGCMPFIWRAG